MSIPDPRIAAALAAAGNTECLKTIPRPGAIPPGRVVVHNHVYPVARQLGTRGSRAWLADPGAGPRLAACDCGWAPELGQHYRIASIPAPAGGLPPPEGTP